MKEVDLLAPTRRQARLRLASRCPGAPRPAGRPGRLGGSRPRATPQQRSRCPPPARVGRTRPHEPSPGPQPGARARSPPVLAYAAAPERQAHAQPEAAYGKRTHLEIRPGEFGNALGEAGEAAAA